LLFSVWTCLCCCSKRLFFRFLTWYKTLYGRGCFLTKE
jgi:hypothetical protein